MSAMLEKMAEAMWSVKTTDDAFPLDGAPETEPMWRGLPERERDRWRYRARAALLAIREPDSAMMAARIGSADEPYWYERALEADFTAMIDAILGDEKP